MFRSFTKLSTLAIGILSVFVLTYITWVRKEDLSSYLRSKSEQEQIAKQPLFSTAKQNRKQVRKDIWFSQENLTRLQHRIDSSSSVLILQPTGRSIEVVEQLCGVHCWMQDKLYTLSDTPMQQVRFIEAEEGIYRYRLQNFVANQVTLSLFRLPGSLLPTDLSKEHPFLKGNAKDITFTISGNTPQFQAQNFKATLKAGGS